MKRRRAAELFGGAAIAAAVLCAAGCSEEDTAPPPASQGAPARTVPAEIIIDESAATVSVPATVAKQGSYKELAGAIEFLLVSAGGKEYETVFVTSFTPKEIYDALLKIGLHPGQPGGAETAPRGQPVRIDVTYARGGRTLTVPADRFVLRVTDAKTKPVAGRPLEPIAWPFTGSGMTDNPETGEPALRATLTGEIVALHPTEASPLFQNPRAEARQSNIYHANVAELPPPASPVRVVFRRLRTPPPPGTRRVYVLAAGRVQGVGFRNFTQMQARRLKLAGFVRNLRDGRVEAVAEGPAAAVDQWLTRVKRGPRAARVEEFDVADEKPAGDFGTFEIWY